ncbi:MAG: hypothetical protein WDM91_12340 [Rhizomicrobium sp.]
MKRIICAVLALSLLGTTAAEARGWGGYHGHYHHGGRGDVALGFGLGFLALGILAAESAHHDRYDRDRDYYDRGRGPDGAYDRDGDRGDGARTYDRGRDSGYDRDNGAPGRNDHGPADRHDDGGDE